jgi:reactive intermediate/imine deaminase
MTPNLFSAAPVAALDRVRRIEVKYTRISVTGGFASIIALSLPLLLASCAAPRRTYFAAANIDAPFSRAVLVGDTLYVSGAIAFVPETRKPYDDPSEEARRLMQSVGEALAEAGMTYDDLVYVTVYCRDLSLYDTFNATYREYFDKEFPARAFVGAGDLLFGVRFELQAIAVKRR